MTSLFERVPLVYRPAIEAARSLLPQRVQRLIEPRFLCGIDPVYVGLHQFDDVIVCEGRPPVRRSELAHACCTFLTPDARQTIVYPELELYPDPVATIVHEYGHLFDEATGFQLIPPATTRYSRTNRWERFAEAFEKLLRPPSEEWRLFMQGEPMRPLRQLVGVDA